MAIKFFAFFFPTISTFGCFWSQWPTSLAVTSGCPTMRCGRLPSRSDVNIQKTVNSSSALLVPALILSVPGACCSSWSNLGKDHGQVPPQSSPVGLEMQKSEATKQPPLNMLDLVRFVTRLKGKRDVFNATAPEHAAPISNSTSEHQPGGWPTVMLFTLAGIGLFLHQRCDLASWRLLKFLGSRAVAAGSTSRLGHGHPPNRPETGTEWQLMGP